MENYSSLLFSIILDFNNLYADLFVSGFGFPAFRKSWISCSCASWSSNAQISTHYFLPTWNVGRPMIGRAGLPKVHKRRNFSIFQNAVNLDNNCMELKIQTAIKVVLLWYQLWNTKQTRNWHVDISSNLRKRKNWT